MSYHHYFSASVHLINRPVVYPSQRYEKHFSSTHIKANDTLVIILANV